MRQFLTKICLSSSVFFMASCGMFGGDEEETVEEAPVVAAAEETAEETPETEEETTEAGASEPVILDDEVATGEIERLPASSDGPHIIKRDGKFWIIAEPSAQLSGVLKTLGDNVQGINYEPSPSYLRLARELNYRINEMAFNTGATTEDYKELFEKSLQTIEAIAIAEAEASRACVSCETACDEKKESQCEVTETPAQEEQKPEVPTQEEQKLEVITEHK